MSNNKHLADLLKVCSILPALAIMPAMGEGIGLEKMEDVLEYSQTSDLYSLKSSAVIGSFSGYDASDRYEATVVFVGKGQELSISDGAVIKDNRAQVGGAIAITGNQPVATLHVGKGVQFVNNEALFDGGAIGNYGNTIVAEKALFQGNKAQLAPTENLNQIGGGAISLGSLSNTSLVDTDFIGNESGYNGGAIGTRLADKSDGKKNDNSIAVLKIKDGEFVANKANGYTDNKGKQIAGNGGAIYNSFYADVVVDGTDFKNNYAAKSGGAIYNDGAADAKGNGADMTIKGADFESNFANSSGGAIFNQGGLIVEDSEFNENFVTAGDGGAIRVDVTNGAKTKILKSEFEQNKALGYASADGGALSIRNGDVEISDSDFAKNEAMFGGALYLYTGNNHYVSVDITGGEFNENKALAGGAIVNVASNKNNENGGLRLTDVKFNSNAATSELGNGGAALFLGAQSQTYITRGVFSGNTSAAAGGAISMRDGDNGNNQDARLDIVDSVFANNIAATQGGAIYSTFYNSVQETDNVYLSGTSFVNNKAKVGGAIYNEGNADLGDNFASMKLHGVSFVGNVATDKGGAIFNGEGGTVNISGNNVFENNIAGKGANDIFNDGTLNITDGKTSINGGILGGGTLTLAQNATLDIAATSIQQSKIDLQGKVIASIVNNQRNNGYGRFVSKDITIGEDAVFELNVGAVGTYNIWDGKLVKKEQVFVGDIYEIAGIDANGVTIVTKSVADVADNIGVSSQAAGTLVGLANSNSGKAHQVSLALQKVLDSEDKKQVEQEAKKLAPEQKPVAQAIASSVQNQVLSVATGRMAGGMTAGRAGGDETQDNGFWMHGLFNKSKLDDQFHGYTRGVAFGMDTVIDRKYTLGAGLAFNNSDVHSDGLGSTDIDSKTLFVYGQYKPNKWFVNATATYSMSEYTENRSLGGVVWSNEYDVDSYGAQVMTGYDFATGVTTEAGVRYLYVSQDAYTDGLNFTDVKASDTNFLTGVAGLKYSFAIENDWAVRLKPELRAALTYDLVSEADTAVVDMPGVASYAVDGERLNRLGGEFGIGLTADYKGLKITLMYDLDLHKDYTSQTGMIKLRSQF